MKLFKKLRKGFTLIELVVVIAVIAILTAVSIVSYVSITNKAKQSNDQQKIDQVNLSAQALEVTEKPKTMHDALEAVEADGFVVENFKAEAKDYEFGYSLSENRFLILSKGKVVYPKAMTKLTKSPDIWRFSADKSYNDGYSHYLLSSVSGEVSIENGGLDVGKSGVTKVSFHSTNGGEYVVRTFGGEVQIGKSETDVAKGQIYLYGLADKSVVYAENQCLHNRGAVGKMELKAGKSIAEKGAVIYLTQAKAGSEIKEDGGKFFIPETVKVSEISTTVAKAAGYDTTGVSDPNATFANNEVKKPESKSHDIGTLAELENFRDLVNGGFAFSGCKVKLTANITLDKGWTPIAVGSRDVAATHFDGSYCDINSASHLFKGEFDGQGHTISNLTNEDYVPEYDYLDGGENAYAYGFFGILDAGSKISNLKFANVNISKDFGKVSKTGKATEAESIGALVGYVHGDVEISNITVVSGTISSSKGNPACGGIIGRWYSAQKNTTLKNLKNSAKVDSCRSAGIVGYISAKNAAETPSTPVTFDFVDCTNNGQIVNNSGRKLVAQDQIANFGSSYTKK